jgi:hypothetical protein
MAKKKKATTDPDVQPQPTKPRETILSLKGTTEWSEWLTDFAAKMRTTKAGVIDRALTELAERSNYREPPER